MENTCSVGPRWETNWLSRRAWRKEERFLKIPLESPLRLVLKYWEERPRTRNLVKEQMVEFCVFDWLKYKLDSGFVWPQFGSFDPLLRQN